MSINNVALVAAIGFVLSGCASTQESSTGSNLNKTDARHRMIAQMEEDRADQQAAQAAHAQREIALEHQTEADRAQDRDPR